MPSHTDIGEFLWHIADHLRGDYEKNDNEDVILPFTLLRRIDCVLEKTRDKVRETEKQVAGKVNDDVLKQLLIGAAGVPFYNHSPFSFTELLKDAANIKDNFGAWLEGFSDNIKEILYNFCGGPSKGLAPIYETLAEKKLLYLITKEFASEELDLHPDAVSNHDTGCLQRLHLRPGTAQQNLRHLQGRCADEGRRRQPHQAGQHPLRGQAHRPAIQLHDGQSRIRHRLEEDRELHLFNGDAGSGWSDIRKWIITNDWLDAIVALPEDMFYNTNIATYLWIVRNNKPAARRGTITLVNGNQDRFRTLMRRNLGKKRVELSPTTMAELVGVYREGKPVPKLAQVFDLEDFGYTRVTVERPLRLRFEVTAERLDEFRQSGYFTGLVSTKKVGDKAKADIAKGEEKQLALLVAMERVKAICPCMNDHAFQQFINDALPFKATAQVITALRSAFGTADETAEKVLLKPLEPDFDSDTAEADPGAWYATDSELRDEERIPLKTDIAAYFAREVLPYAADAWMDRSKDKVGYEISFTKYFYEYQPPRDLKAILADLEALDAEADKLQAELRA